MKERPILFSAPMVRAILDGRKTQTRRVVKPQPSFPFGVKQIVQVPDPWHDEALAGTPAEGMGTKGPRLLKWHCEDYAGNLVAGIGLKCKYGLPGDRLWVKETFRVHGDCGRDKASTSTCTGPDDCEFAADFTGMELDAREWRPSIHMPRWASRITLEVVGVRVERLQEITLPDCDAEGAEPTHKADGVFDSTETFRKLWNGVYRNWDANPWVWVVEFKRINP